MPASSCGAKIPGAEDFASSSLHGVFSVLVVAEEMFCFKSSASSLNSEAGRFHSACVLCLEIQNWNDSLTITVL